MICNPFGIVICEFLEPQSSFPEETPEHFADRVGTLMSMHLNNFYSDYTNDDFFWFYGKGSEDKCSAAWKSEQMPNGRFKEICKKLNVSGFNGIQTY